MFLIGDVLKYVSVIKNINKLEVFCSNVWSFVENLLENTIF